YKYNINLIVENGYIVAAHWDAIKEDDNLTGGHSTEEIQNWNHQAQLLESYLINIQDPTLITYNEDNKTDAISGVTIEVNQFIELVIQALASGPTID
ncbi:FMN-binding protein, partial [Turicibacter sanguinis]|nr:FMN-binding protein [Turicibacter sanguinis]